MKDQLKTVSGKTIALPMFDPLVAAHFNNPSALVGTLLEQINGGMYKSLFAGKRDATFLDIGANIGLVSLHASDACRRIVAVEPALETFDVLRAMTTGVENIELMRAALAPVDGVCEFFTNDLNSTASSTVNTYGVRTTVPGWTLNSILRSHQLEKVDVCKIDCEGAEGESLSFAQLEQAAPVIKSYFIEFHNCPKTTWEYKLGTAVSHLSTLGYKMTVSGMGLIATK